MTPRVDIVIPTHNGNDHLRICLPALRDQTYRDFQVVVVDDASREDIAAIVRELMPEAITLRLERNSGLAVAINRALSTGNSELVALLNDDTEPEPGWLAALVDTINRHPEAGSIASRMRLFDRRDTFHSTGDTFSRRGVPGNRGVWQVDTGQFEREEEVFAACAGAALYRRAALQEAAAIDGQVLDPGFFMYCEDVDLNWRLRLLDYRTVYAPDAIVYHRLSATGGGPLASYYVARNMIGVLVKDVPGPLWRRYWHRFIREQVRGVISTVPHLREPAARARLRGLVAALPKLRHWMAQRKRIQAQIRVQLAEIERLLIP